MSHPIHVGNTAGDWEAIYVGGELICEGHSIDAGDWVQLINCYQPKEADCFEVESDYLNEMGGNFPDNFNDIPKEVFV